MLIFVFGRVVSIKVFVSSAPHCCGFESHKLAYGMNGGCSTPVVARV